MGASRSHYKGLSENKPGLTSDCAPTVELVYKSRTMPGELCTETKPVAYSDCLLWQKDVVRLWSCYGQVGMCCGAIQCNQQSRSQMQGLGLYNQNQVTKAHRTTSGAVLLATEHKSTTANTSQGPFGSSSTTYGIGAFSTAAIDYQAIFHLTFAFHDFRIGQSGNADIGD